MRTRHSNALIQNAGVIVWLAIAGGAVAWMLNGGGLIRPVAAFTILISGLGMVLLASCGATLYERFTMAVEYGAVSGLLLLIGTLFVEFWPVTLSMACMFAVGRGLRHGKQDEKTAVFG